MKRVIIPKSKLGHKLDAAAQLKRQAQDLLRQLEEQYAGKPIADKPGGWRHNPLGWQKRHKP